MLTDADLTAIQSALVAEGVDAWFFASFRGSDPIAARVLGMPAVAMATRRWFYLVPARGEPLRLVHGIEPHMLDGVPGRLQTYGRWQAWQAALRTALSGTKRLACQFAPDGIVPALGRLDAGLGDFLRGLGVELVSSGDLVARFVASLDAAQVASHRFAMKVLLDTVNFSFDRVRAALRAGAPLTEYALQQEMVQHLQQGGLVTDAPPIVGVDAHGADPHYEPGPEGSWLIQKDQVLLLDLWGKQPGPRDIYADITWCAWTGARVPDEQARVWDVATKSRDAGVARAEEVARRVVYGFEVNQAARAVIDQAGYGEYFIHRTGHSIHTEDHADGANMDDYETHDTRRLLPNTVFSVEPGIYLPGRFGFRTEVNVLVREQEAVLTGKAQGALPALLAG